MRRVSKLFLLATVLILLGIPAVSLAQTPAPAPKKPLPAGPPSPQSTHYLIPLLAFGNDPN